MCVPFWHSDLFIHYLNLEGAYFVLFTKIHRMKKGNFLLSGMLAMLTVLLMAGCMGDADPVRVSLDIDASDLVMNIGETSTRMGSSKAADSHFTYRTDNPSVATVDEDGKVTARSIGEATITVHMDENRTDWYAATDRSYRVVVKAPSAEILRQYDRDTPLTFVALEDGKITITFNNGITLDDDIVYTINDGDEKIISKDTKGAYDIVVKKNDFVQLFSYNDALSSGIAAGARGSTRAVADGAKYINIKPAMKTEIYGNVMSMLEGDFFDDDCVIDADYAFYGLFAGAEKLVNNPFRHIELPAYELTEGCFQAMFYGCKGLQRAPDLLADELMVCCYKEMFAGCSKLSYVKCYAEDISADDCTKDWLAGAGSEATDGKTLATTFKFPANSNDGVPAGWTNELIYSVKSVTLNKTSLEMIAGSAETGTATLTATVAPEYASDKTVFWLTSNEKVATVDDNGKVTAVGSGEAKITATAGGKYASCTVKVTVLVTGITLDKSELSMRVGDNPVTLVAKVTPEGATDKTVTWRSSNEKVATVDANGKVTSVGNGTATITATAGGKTATCKLSVGYGVALSKATVGMFIGADGWAYKSRDEATASGTTPEAWIAYKSDKAGESLATSLNHDGTNVNWFDFKSSPGWSSNPSRAAIAGGTWRWPTKADYDKMVPGFCTLKQALGNGVIDRGSYWTKTETQNSSPLAYCLIFDGRGSYTTSIYKTNIGYCFVRAVLAF